jgi:hypothetical protein
MGKILRILVFLLLFAGIAHALGTVTKNDAAVLGENESARFTILFWSDDEQYVELWVKEAPANWIVIIEPDNFKINESSGNEYIVLPDRGTKKALPVDIFVKPSGTSGTQHVVIGARSGNQSEGIVFMQERAFTFTIEGKSNFSEPAAEKNNSIAKNQTNNEKYQAEKREEINYLIYLALFLVVLFSVLIYKYS